MAPASTSAHVRVLVDTNCFLHLRDLKDLPWRSIFPALKRLEIIVAPVVTSELDRLKTDRTGRVRDRARAALDLIERASNEPGMRLRLRATPLEIDFVISPGRRIDWSAFDQLDPTWSDDRLLAEALSDAVEPQPVLLSHDTGPLIRARGLGLTAQRAPADWELPPQQEKLAQDNARLVREIAQLKSTRPEIELSFPDVDEEGFISLPSGMIEELPDQAIKAIVEAGKARWPRETVIADCDTGLPFSTRIGGISTYQVSDYHSDYSRFIDEIAGVAKNLHLHVVLALRYGQIRFDVSNPSAVTAEGLRVQARRWDQGEIYANQQDLRAVYGATPLLRPPSPPRDLHAMMPAMFELKEDRVDPTEFREVERDAPTAISTFACAEFRPTEAWRGSVYAMGAEAQDFRLAFEISARNLAAPVRAEVNGRYVRRTLDWSDPAVLGRLPSWMAEAVTATL